jgi:hypothetical protein
MRLARGADEGIPGVVGGDVASDRPAAGAQCRAMWCAAGIAPLSSQQFNGLLGIGYVSDRTGYANRDFDRPGKPSLDHRESPDAFDNIKRRAFEEVSSRRFNRA